MCFLFWACLYLLNKLQYLTTAILYWLFTTAYFFEGARGLVLARAKDP